MGTCKDCAFWMRSERVRGEWQGLELISHSSPANYGKCECPQFVYTRESHGDDLPNVCPGDGLAYGDHDGYSADFRTGEDFGCIHFTAKDRSQ